MGRQSIIGMPSRADLLALYRKKTKCPPLALIGRWAFPYLNIYNVATPGLLYGEKAGRFFVWPPALLHAPPAPSTPAGRRPAWPDALIFGWLLYPTFSFGAGASSLYKTISPAGGGDAAHPAPSARHRAWPPWTGGACRRPKAQHNPTIPFLRGKDKKKGRRHIAYGPFLLIRCASGARR